MMRHARCLICMVLPLSACLHLHAQEEKRLEDLLALDLNELVHVKVVSALKASETVGRVPATVRVITAEQIQEAGYFTLEEALADLPGLQFRNIVGFNSYVFMRGVPSQNNAILLLVDGVQINELNSGGFYAGGQFNLTNVERIEVLYGPASALYGTNALSGIISIFTRDPEGPQGGRATIQAGRFHSGLADFRFGAYDEKKELGYTLSAMVKRSDKADLKGREGDYNWTEAMDNFENDVALDARVRYKGFSAGVVFQDKDASRATTQVAAPGAAPPLLSDHGVNWHIRFFNAWLTYEYDAKETWSIRSTTYYRDSTVLDDTIPIIELPYGGSPGSQVRWCRPNHLIGNETLLRWSPAPRWKWTLGLVLERERLAKRFSVSTSGSAEEPPPPCAGPEMMTNRLVSAYAQVQTSLSQDTDLFLGVRHDDSSYYGTVDTPRVGLVFNRGRLTLKALYTRAFRAPKPWDYTNGAGNPHLEPEESTSLEATGGWSFSDHLRLDLSLYRNRVDNLLTRADEGASWRWINRGAITTDGCEATLEYRRGRVGTYVNYTYTRSEDDGGGQVPEIAPQGANAGIRYAFTPKVSALLRGQYTGPRKNTKVVATTGSDRVAAALVLHATLTVKLPRGFDLQLGANNLLDEVYYHPSNLPPSRYRQPQRAFWLKLGYSF